MKITSEHIKIALFAFIGVMLLLMILRKKEAVPDRSGEIKALEKLAQSYHDAMLRERDYANERITDHLRADSMLQIKDKATIVKYATIPVYINSLSRDSLRAEVLRFAK